MKKIVKIKDTYEVVIDNCENMTNTEIKKTALEVVKLIQRKEIRDMYEPISSFKTFKYLDKTKQGLDVVKVFEDLRDNRMHVICHRPSDDTYIIGLGYSPDDGVWNQGRYDFSSLDKAEAYLKKDYKVKEFVKETKDIKVEDVQNKGEQIVKVLAEALKGECGPFGGENPELKGNKLGLYSQAPTEWFVFNEDGSVDFENLEELINDDPDNWSVDDEDDKTIVISENKHFDSVKDLLHSDLLWFEYLDEADILGKIDAILKEEVTDAKVGDIPVNSPEEEVNITYTEKLKGGKNALTFGMIENAFKDRGKDGGKTFEAYINVVIESLKDDIKNAEFIVSGEMKPTRKLLLEDYVKIEHLVEKAGLEDKLTIMSPLVDELSEKLNLNYWKQPKFKKSTQKQASRELRNKHRWDSKITKTMKPVFLCTKSDLTASYNDAKQGKLPEVFEGNLEKVRKDMAADYDRIMQGRDTYVEDPRINKTLPEIVDLYKTALKYADDLEYSDYAREFALMLETIKKHWGLAGE